MKTYVFDIDGTVCTISDPDYVNAKPFSDRIKIINKLYDDGNIVIFYTARGMGRTNNSYDDANRLLYDFTKDQLDLWGIRYHNLFLGKPTGDIYVDDKCINDDDFFTRLKN